MNTAKSNHSETEVRMMGARMLCRSIAIGAFVLGLVAIAAPGYGQTGQVKGKVVDAAGKPVEGAVVTIEATDSGSRKFTVKTNRNGEYVQIGLQPGPYKITATKDKLSDTMERRIGLDMAEVNFTLTAASAGGNVSEEERKKAAEKNAAVKSAFDEGVALSNSGKNDEAIAKFNEVLALLPKCAECYTNIGANYSQKKDWAQAEAAYKKALEVDASSAAAYNGLANAYNAQKKFDQAAEASAQAMKLSAAAGGAGGAAAGPSASGQFNQGVILWNAGKIAEAKAQFAEAVKIDPKLADAHYWLGMANLNEGKMPDAATHFDEYLKLAPSGQYAEQAKGILSQIKK
jgi:tetratricopeptide (TPR) repeat protein